MSNYTIEAVSFGPDGVRVAYMTPTDVRVEGEVFQAHTIAISWQNEALAPLISKVEDAADELLREAIITWARGKPMDLEAERQAAIDALDDDDKGLGS